MNAEASPDVVRIIRIIDAPREEVFSAWTEPEQLRRWWGPGEFSCTEADVDLRQDGTYRLVMQPPGGEAFVLGGTYREVVAPQRLVYTWRWETGAAADGSESLGKVEFHAHGDQTEVMLTHSEFPETHGAAPYQLGWEGGFVKFERLLGGGVGA